MLNLRCENISKTFNGVDALQAVSIDFPKSEIAAIIGPNGAGKTTLLNVFSGFIAPETGCCLLDEQEITHLPPYRIARSGISRTFQDLRLIGRLSARENVMLACPQQRGENILQALFSFSSVPEETHTREKASALLHYVGIEGVAAKRAEELSYGQQKLLTIACCLAMEASILLLDEPVAGVHPELRSQILSLLQELQNEDKLIVFIEHDIEAVQEIADTVIVMDTGSVIARGKPDSVLERQDILEAYLT
jgi:ABC-type branched-subunit amino acid transport system ATPase component